MKTKRSQKRTAERPVKLAYSYRRYSSKNQERGTSLERQLEEAQAVCTEKAWQLVDLPPDEKVSAFKVEGSNGELAANMHRGNLGSFLKQVETGKIPEGSVLIVEKLDRFSRHYWDIVFPVWINLMQSGIEVYSCVSRTHYTLSEIRKNPMLGAMALMEFAQANEYSSGMSDRIGKAFGIRLAQCAGGQKMNLGGWVPKWFDFVGPEKQAGKYVPNEHFETVKRVSIEYIEGRSMYQIAKGLIADNIPTVMGGKWAQGTIANLLRHPTLTGTLTLKQIVIPDFYPPVLNQKQWDKLQAKLRENRERKGGDGASDLIANLFRNRCKCAHCNGTVTTAKSASHRLYTCKTKRLDKCPSKYSIRVADLEASFFIEFLKQSPDQIFSKQTPEHSDLIARTQASIAKTDKQIAEATELLGIVPIAELKSKLAALEQKRQTDKAVLDKLNNRMLSNRSAPKAFMDIKAIVSRFLSPQSGAAFVDAFDRARRQYGDPIAAFSHALKTDPDTVAFDKAVKEIQAALRNNETRKRLLNLLPSIVSQLIIDTTKGRYAVVNHNGQQSEWFEVV